MKTKRKLGVCLSIMAASIFISASSEPVAPGAPHMPPQEALDACKSKMDNDDCSFVGRNQENIEGKCHKGPNGQGELACMPKPPKEAVDACQGKAENDACSFTGKNQEQLTGTCLKGPMGQGEMACVPLMHMPAAPAEQPAQAPSAQEPAQAPSAEEPAPAQNQ